MNSGIPTLQLISTFEVEIEVNWKKKKNYKSSRANDTRFPTNSCFFISDYLTNTSCVRRTSRRKNKREDVSVIYSPTWSWRERRRWCTKPKWQVLDRTSRKRATPSRGSACPARLPANIVDHIYYCEHLLYTKPTLQVNFNERTLPSLFLPVVQRRPDDVSSRWL